MKKLKSISFIALLAAMLLGGVNTAWAQTVIGAEDNTTDWWTVFSDPYTIAPNKTQTLKFTNYSSKTANYNNFSVILTQDVDWGTAGSEYLVLRADNYGWQYGLNTGAESPSHGWYNYLQSNYNWDTFKDDMDGATVTLTIRRVLMNVTVRADIKTASNAEYFEEFQLPCGNGLQNIRAYLTVDKAHLVMDNAATSIADSDLKQVVGSEDNTAAWWTAFSDYFSIAPNQSQTIEFDNFSDKAENFHNWLVFVTSNAGRGADGYTEYGVLRADNYAWGTYGNTNSAAPEYYDGYVLTSNYNWETFKDDMDGSHVRMTISRSGEQVTIYADITASSGTKYFEQLVFDAKEQGSETLRFFLSTEGGHLVLNGSSVATVGATGWATFSSDYALDFSAVSGLKAYMVTGHDGSAVTLEQVTGTVPANTALLLEGAADNYSIPVVASSATDASANLLVAGTGAAVSAESGKTKYALSSEAGAAVFKKIDAVSPVIAKGKAYLVFNETIAAPSLGVEEPMTTAIDAVKGAAAAQGGVRYNMAGQQVGKGYRGLVIENGKKVMVK